MNKGNVVVIDDSHIMRKLAMIALSEEGYKVYTAENGEEGLELAEKVSPSVIIVDFIMPRMNGYQFCKLLKDSEKLKDVPVILVTGKGEDTGIQFRKKFGVCSYLIKPFEPIELVDMVNSIVQSQPVEEEPSLKVAYTAMKTEEFQEIEDAGIKEEITPQIIREIEPQPEPVYSTSISGTEEISRTEEFEESFEEPKEIAKPVSTYLKADLRINEEASSQMITETEPQPEPVSASVSEIEKIVESTIRNYFSKEFPSLLQNNIADILRQSPTMKTSDIILSGELSYFNIFDIFQIVESEKLTGCLYIYSPAMSYEVYFDKGYVALATTSSEGKNILSKEALERKGISKEKYNRSIKISMQKGITLLEAFASEGILSEEEITAILREHTGNVIRDIINTDTGKFFLEKVSLPDYIMNMPVRLKASQFIFEAVKSVAKKQY